MLTTDECFYIGYVKKAHGLEGELEIILDVDDPLQYRKKESMLLEVNNNLIPFFIDSIAVRNKSAIVQFKNIHSVSDLQSLLGAQVYLPLSELPPLKGKKQFYFHEVVGYEVWDINKGKIGNVKSVMDNLHQPVLQVVHEEKEILVPLVDEFIDSVDKTNKKFILKTPEGLLDIYLND